MKKVSLFLIALTFFSINAEAAENKISFWNITKKGANIFNEHVTREDIKAAKAYGIAFIRLSPDKFSSTERDFLIGNADNFERINSEDLKELITVLDICAEEKMPVVLTMLSLPGSRWKQNNNNKDDLRIWTDPKFQKQTIEFWQDLTVKLANHPAIVGFNILNEPHLERIFNKKAINISNIAQPEVQEILFKFYKNIISAIRSINQDIPIILDSTAYADPNTFKHLKPQPGDNIIYSFHIYEPYNYTNIKINQGKFKYPGNIAGKYWNKTVLQNYLQEVLNFQKRYNIPSNRILVGEFGGNRSSNGLPQYFQDLIEIFKENNWHFAFYAFREDVWDGMDYELGDKKLPWSYWQDLENGRKPKLDRKKDYPQFKVLLEALKP